MNSAICKALDFIWHRRESLSLTLFYFWARRNTLHTEMKREQYASAVCIYILQNLKNFELKIFQRVCGEYNKNENQHSWFIPFKVRHLFLGLDFAKLFDAGKIGISPILCGNWIHFKDWKQLPFSPQFIHVICISNISSICIIFSTSTLVETLSIRFSIFCFDLFSLHFSERKTRRTLWMNFYHFLKQYFHLAQSEWVAVIDRIFNFRLFQDFSLFEQEIECLQYFW